MALDKPSAPYASVDPVMNTLRYAGTLSGLDLGYHIAFRGEFSSWMVLAQLHQLSYQGHFVTISYTPLFDDYDDDGGDYREATLAVDDLIWVFPLVNIDKVIALRNDLKTKLTRTVSA